MTEHPNALLIRQAWQAVAQSDVETLKELWDDSIVWHVTGDNPWQGDYFGHKAVLEYLAKVGESGDSYDVTLTEVLAGNEHAALLCHVSTKRGNRVLEVDQMLVGRIENRRIVEVWALFMDPQRVRSFWS